MEATPEDEIHDAADGSYKKLTPSEPTAQNYQPGQEQNTEDTRTDRDPAEGGDGVVPPAPAEAQPS